MPSQRELRIPVVARLLAQTLLCAVILIADRGGYAAGYGAASAGVAEVRGQFRREFTDPCLGQHWRLVSDPAHPGGPGRLVLLDPQGPPATTVSNRVATEAPLVIRAGDSVTVDQDTGRVHARFQAIAIESAESGGPLHVRLTVNTDRRQGRNVELTAPGQVISVVARGPGVVQWTTSASISPLIPALPKPVPARAGR